MAAAELVLDQIRLESFFSQNEFRAQSQVDSLSHCGEEKGRGKIRELQYIAFRYLRLRFLARIREERKKHQQFTSCLALPYKGLPPMKSLHLLTSLGMPSVFGNFSLMHWAKSTAVLGSMNNG